jgi:hypothetical protein
MTKAMAAAMTEARERREREDRARIDEVIAEFGGATDPPDAMVRMAEEPLYWRRRIRWIEAVVAKIRK